MSIFKNTSLKIYRRISRLSLRWKIYLSLAGILIPVSTLIIFIQQQITRPFLEEEVRQTAVSVCRSLSSDILAFQLLNKPDQLERRLVEASWQQPSIVRIDVLVREDNKLKVVSSNIADETPPDYSALAFEDAPVSILRTEEERSYWEITFPVRTKTMKRVIAHIHAEVSLQLVDKVVSIFSKITSIGAVVSATLLIMLLSYYLRRMIENERRLRRAEFENVQLTEQLSETERQLFLNEKLAIMGQMTASFAHEIGTPLNSLSGHLQLLHEDVSNEPAKNRLDIINSQVSRIEGIVREFLASTHTPPQQRKLVEVMGLIRRITNLVTPRLTALAIDLKIEVQRTLEPIRLVPTDLEQVLLNLTNNSVDALEAEKKPDKLLEFHAFSTYEGQQKNLVIQIKDNGTGIDPSALKKVLKPFFTTKAPGQGTGLGLTISQKIVKKYQGKLEIQSELGKGTEVTVSIPYDLS